MLFLETMWSEVGQGTGHRPAPTLLQADLDLVLRATRDLFTHDVDKLIIDNPRIRASH